MIVYITAEAGNQFIHRREIRRVYYVDRDVVIQTTHGLPEQFRVFIGSQEKARAYAIGLENAVLNNQDYEINSIHISRGSDMTFDVEQR